MTFILWLSPSALWLTSDFLKYFIIMGGNITSNRHATSETYIVNAMKQRRTIMTRPIKNGSTIYIPDGTFSFFKTTMNVSVAGRGEEERKRAI